MRGGRCVITAFVCCLLVGACGAPPEAEEPKPATPEAKDILDRMARAYAECRTYRDSGVVKTVFITTVGKQTRNRRTVEKPFTTAFVRPDRFRYEFTNGDSEDRYLAWQKGEEVLVWWYAQPQVQKEKSLGLALAGATGVSSGSAHTVPSMLLPEEVGGRRPEELPGAKRIEDGRFDDADRYRIEGRYSSGPDTLWIDKKTYLLRRIDQQRSGKDYRTEETTTYAAFLDEAVPDKMLVFDPPK
jgi:outer membrane lipoprotein-sorting protein